MMAQLMGLPTVTPAELLRLTREGKALVFDVNAPERWREAHVPGATNVDPSTFDAALLPQDRSSLIVFYCSGPLCRKAPNAALRARKLGYTDARVLAAGISGWLGAKLPVESGGAG